MSVILLSLEDLDTQLLELKCLLLNLPDSLLYANQHYNFSVYASTDEEVADYSADSVVNHTFELVFCPSGCKHGITLRECGPELMTVVEVLQKYNKQFSNHAVLQKWVTDLIDTVKNAGAKVCYYSFPYIICFTPISLIF